MRLNNFPSELVYHCFSYKSDMTGREINYFVRKDD